MSSVELEALKFLHLTGSVGSQEVVQGKACGERAVPSACLRSVNDLCCRDKSLAYWFSSPLMNPSPHFFASRPSDKKVLSERVGRLKLKGFYNSSESDVRSCVCLLWSHSRGSYSATLFLPLASSSCWPSSWPTRWIMSLWGERWGTSRFPDTGVLSCIRDHSSGLSHCSSVSRRTELVSDWPLPLCFHFCVLMTSCREDRKWVPSDFMLYDEKIWLFWRF